MFRLVTICQILAVTVTFVGALEHYDNFREGSCSDYPSTPIKANREFIDSMRYISAGNRYHMYRLSSVLPSNAYLSMTEEELVQTACYSRNATTIIQNSTATAFGFFGRELFSVRMVSRPGIYFEGLPLNPLVNSVGLRDVITLTDNKSFAFIVVCWTGEVPDTGAWAVVSNTPIMDASTRRIIEGHAVSLGFRRENVVLLSYDRCYDRDSQSVFE